MRRMWLVATWVGATALVSWVTFQALASAEEGVGDATLPPVVVAATEEAVETSTTTSTRADPSTSREPSTTVEAPAATTAEPTTAGEAPARPSTSATTSATTVVTAPPTTSPTSTAGTSTSSAPAAAPETAAAWQNHVVSSGGGTVTVRYRPGEVQYQAAVPAPGYDVEIDEQSPEVRVEFIGEDDDWDVRVRWNDGALDIDVSN